MTHEEVKAFHARLVAGKVKVGVWVEEGEEEAEERKLRRFLALVRAVRGEMAEEVLPKQWPGLFEAGPH